MLMNKPEVHHLIDLYQKISKCRECNLSKNCRPQLRPPGPGYKRGGFVFVQINPGYIGAMSKDEMQIQYKSAKNKKIVERKIYLTKDFLKYQNLFLKNSSIENYNAMVSHFNISRYEWGWPPGKFRETINNHGVEMKDVAIINLAQCPIEKNRYTRILKPCYEKWFKEMIDCLNPVAIITQGKVVHNFLRNELPTGINLIEGIHHADRRSKEIKQQILLHATTTIKGLP